MNGLHSLFAFFKRGTTLMRLIYINVGVFLITRLAVVFLRLFNIDYSFLLNLELPASVLSFLTHPWTLFTYMFLHEEIMHLFFNMLWFYWFGKLFLQFFNQKQLTVLYLFGGISGGLLYVLAYNLFPFFDGYEAHSYLIGASAAILAIVIGVASYAPTTKLNLMFIGEVSLRTIAIVTVLIDLLSITSENAGGHWAHLGGILIGFVYGSMMKNGYDLTRFFVQRFESVLSFFSRSRDRKPKMKVTYQDVRRESDWDYNARKQNEEKDIDLILDKIKKSGYESLSADEKKRLFDSSKS
ncbi:MAG: rhomboid family intramembrane serine protease [Bacteroidales bacterium]|nr:rhomboid family intramembrane serine protease [Bacteroidales bacterium]